MLDIYIQTFQTVAVQMAPLIIPVFAIYLIVSLISNLLFTK